MSAWTAISSRLLVEGMTLLTSFWIGMLTSDTHVVLPLLLQQLAQKAHYLTANQKQNDRN